MTVAIAIAASADEAIGLRLTIGLRLRQRKDPPVTVVYSGAPRSLADYRGWAEASLDTLERTLRDRDFLLGVEFSAADIMVGYTVLVAKALGLVGEPHQ